MDFVEIENLIIGSGPSGLAMGAVLSKKNLNYLILEKSESPFNSWKNHYDRVKLHTTKYFSHLPYFSFPENFPLYVSKKLFLEYLNSYKEKFNLNIETSTEAFNIEKKNSNWIIYTNRKNYISKNIIFCTGYNNEPKNPNWKGKNLFKGEITHSKFYLNGKKYFGKKVLVVGLGNTGGEIAIDLFENGAKVDILVRNPTRIVPRDLFSIPMQYQAILLTYLPNFISDFISRFFLKFFVNDLSKYGIETPKVGTVSQLNIQEKVPLIDIGTLNLIKQGIFKIQKGINEIFENEVLFEDGKKEKYDSIILCTGYKTGLEKIFPSDKTLLNENEYPIIRGKESKEKGIYFLGFTNHLGGFLRNISHEAISIGEEILRNKNERT